MLVGESSKFKEALGVTQGGEAPADVLIVHMAAEVHIAVVAVAVVVVVAVVADGAVAVVAMCSGVPSSEPLGVAPSAKAILEVRASTSALGPAAPLLCPVLCSISIELDWAGMCPTSLSWPSLFPTSLPCQSLCPISFPCQS